MIDPTLKDFCETERQKEVISLLCDNSVREAADTLGVTRRTIRKIRQTVEKNAAKRHYAPKNNQSNPLPRGQTSRGVSQLINEDSGKPVLTWYKSKPVAEALYDDLINALNEHKPKPFPSIKPPKGKSNKDLLDLITLTDYHFGMMAWAKETNEDWDLSIAENTFYHAINSMIQKAKIGQDAETVILNLQGDLLHYDSLEQVTPSSGHILDSDSRAGKMISVVMTCCEWAVLKLLENYKKVHVIVCEGNHDLYGSIWLRKHLLAIFRDNKRVDVDDTEFPYYAYLHGETLLGFHHGHKVKNPSLPALFSCEPRYRKLWGEATYCYIHTGHYHHREKESGEFSGAIVERHPTLAAADAYAVRGGYTSKRGAYVITYHKTLGEISRSSVYPTDIKGVV